MTDTLSLEVTAHENDPESCELHNHLSELCNYVSRHSVSMTLSSSIQLSPSHYTEQLSGIDNSLLVLCHSAYEVRIGLMSCVLVLCRNALSNSVFVPRFNLGHITASDVSQLTSLY